MSRLPWRPRKSDAYAACERASGRCACKELAANPCDAWRMYLRSCAVMNLDTVTAEVERLSPAPDAVARLVEAARAFASWDHCWPGNINLEAACRDIRAALAAMETSHD